jgi:hypothetical protein
MGAIPGGDENAVLAIGKMADLDAGSICEGETTLLPRMIGSLGSPAANWKRNASLLRAFMRTGAPIRDASVDAASGALRDNTGFLRLERNLLRSHGWTYDTYTHMWTPWR